MKKAKFILMAFCILVLGGIAKVSAQSYVAPTDALTILKQQYVDVSSSLDQLQKNNKATEISYAKAKMEYCASMHDAIRAADDVAVGISNVVLLSDGSGDVLANAKTLTKQEMMSIRDQVIALLKL